MAVQFNISENNAYKFFVKINNLIHKTIFAETLEINLGKYIDKTTFLNFFLKIRVFFFFFIINI